MLNSNSLSKSTFNRIRQKLLDKEELNPMERHFVENQIQETIKMLSDHDMFTFWFNLELHIQQSGNY